MMIFTPGGVLLVSESGEGKVVALQIRNTRARPRGRLMFSAD